MDAEEFAEEFINDLPDTLKHMNINIAKLVFNNEVYEQDPELKILRTKLNKIGYDLLPETDYTAEANTSWKLIKI